MDMNDSLSRSRTRNRKAFTVIELLIVIVVVGILIAIVIVAYNSVRRNASEASLKTDLQNASSQIEETGNKLGGYPATGSLVNDGDGLKPSSNNTLTYTQLGAHFCVAATSSVSGVSGAYISSKKPTVSAGNCSRTVSTFAGSGTYGYLDGAAATAQFQGPYDVAFDTAGNLYVAECYGNRIRKITPTGTVSNYAGSGVAGPADGVGAAATFSCPTSLAINAANEIYVVDAYNDRIRKIVPSGTVGSVSTFAGTVEGYADGQGVAAQFNFPYGIAVDNKGFIYVTDGSNKRIRKITPTGYVSTLAGSGTTGYRDGSAATAMFSNNLVGIAVNDNGTVFVADGFNQRIRSVSPQGTVGTIAGSGVMGFADGVGTAAQFGVPFGIEVDGSNTLFVTDGNNNRIRVISSDGVVTTLAGSAFSFQDGDVSVAQFRQPFGIAFDSNENLFIADIDNNRIRKITLP